MKRDMDFIRELLLEIEGGKKAFATMTSETAKALGLEDEPRPTPQECDRLSGHLDLLEQGGLVEIDAKTAECYYLRSMTWAGHDFLDGVRDEETWEKTKAGAAAVKNWSFETLKDIGAGLVKKQIEHWTDVKL